MAVEKTILDSKLIVVVDTGETKNGKGATKNMSFSQLRTDATDEQTLACGNAIAGLVEYDLDSVKRTDTAKLTSNA